MVSEPQFFIKNILNHLRNLLGPHTDSRQQIGHCAVSKYTAEYVNNIIDNAAYTQCKLRVNEGKREKGKAGEVSSRKREKNQLKGGQVAYKLNKILSLQSRNVAYTQCELNC